MNVKHIVVSFGCLLLGAGLIQGCKKGNLMIERPKVTYPVGRFLIDLPEESEIGWGRQCYNYSGPFIKTFRAPTPELVKEVLEADAKEFRVPHEEGGTQLVKIVEGNRGNSWFMFYWRSNLIRDIGNTVRMKGYFWKPTQGFIFTDSAKLDPPGLEEAVTFLEGEFQKVCMRSPLEIPTGPGFCIENAYFQGEPNQDPIEHIAMHINLPSHPDVFVRFSTDTTNYVNPMPLLDRMLKLNSFEELISGIRRIRTRERWVGPYRGQELVERIREKNRTVGYSFMWEFNGEAKSGTTPNMLLEMMTGQGNPPVNSSLSRKEALALWDSMLDSIRFRNPHPPPVP